MKRRVRIQGLRKQTQSLNSNQTADNWWCTHFFYKKLKSNRRQLVTCIFFIITKRSFSCKPFSYKKFKYLTQINKFCRPTYNFFYKNDKTNPQKISATINTQKRNNITHLQIIRDNCLRRNSTVHCPNLVQIFYPIVVT